MKRLFFLLFSLQLVIKAVVAQTADDIRQQDFPNQMMENQVPETNLKKQTGINWIKGLSWEEIKAKAKAERKYIFIDCYATWCMPCKQMDKTVFNNDTVGSYFNERFISIKVQTDVTSKDNEEVKKWYSDAKKIVGDYKVQAMPTYLFFLPDGLLVSKEIGFKEVTNFVALAKKATDPKLLVYYKQLESYKNGLRDFSIMKELAVFVQKTIGDNKLASEIGRNYVDHLEGQDLLSKENIFYVRDIVRDRRMADSLALLYKKVFIERLNDDALITKDNLEFIASFPTVVNSNDRFFQLCYNEPDRIDGIMNRKGWALYRSNSVITKEELYSKLVKDGKPLSKKDPAWDKLEKAIQRKYEKVDAEKIVLDFQVSYYRSINQDWKKWARSYDKLIKTYPPDPKSELGIYMTYNTFGAWEAFQYCNDKTVLRKSLEWIDLGIKLKLNLKLEVYPELDTKANVLYKIGKVKEAISVQEEAIRQAKFIAEKEGGTRLDETIEGFSKVLDKMKKREPTYVDQRAIWNENTLPKKKNR